MEQGFRRTATAMKFFGIVDRIAVLFGDYRYF